MAKHQSIAVPGGKNPSLPDVQPPTVRNTPKVMPVPMPRIGSS